MPLIAYLPVPDQWRYSQSSLWKPVSCSRNQSIRSMSTQSLLRPIHRTQHLHIGRRIASNNPCPCQLRHRRRCRTSRRVSDVGTAGFASPFLGRELDTGTFLELRPVAVARAIKVPLRKWMNHLSSIITGTVPR